MDGLLTVCNDRVCVMCVCGAQRIHENRSAGYRLLNTTYKDGRYRVFELPPNPGAVRWQMAMMHPPPFASSPLCILPPAGPSPALSRLSCRAGAGGLATLEMLNVMEELGVGEMGFNTADYLHASIEAKKLAWCAGHLLHTRTGRLQAAAALHDDTLGPWPVAPLAVYPVALLWSTLLWSRADRAAFYADPDQHNSVENNELGLIWERLSSKAYGRQQAARVDMQKVTLREARSSCAPCAHVHMPAAGDAPLVPAPLLRGCTVEDISRWAIARPQSHRRNRTWPLNSLYGCSKAATVVGEGTPMEQATAVNKGEGDTIYAAFADDDGMTFSSLHSLATQLPSVGPLLGAMH